MEGDPVLTARHELARSPRRWASPNFASDANGGKARGSQLDDFKALVETLADTGLLSIEGSMHSNMGVSSLQTMPISLALQLEDVEVAIANGLGKERFYQKLCEFTKNNTDRL
jgi:hypothetical protein